MIYNLRANSTARGAVPDSDAPPPPIDYMRVLSGPPAQTRSIFRSFLVSSSTLPCVLVSPYAVWPQFRRPCIQASWCCECLAVDVLALTYILASCSHGRLMSGPAWWLILITWTGCMWPQTVPETSWHCRTRGQTWLDRAWYPRRLRLQTSAVDPHLRLRLRSLMPAREPPSA